MHKINRLFKKVVKELWAIKRCHSKIEFKELIDFYREYQFHVNLTVDVINEQVHRYTDVSIPIPFSEEDISYMIDVFIAFNKYNYNRLIIDSLCELNCTQSYQYLNQILDTDEKMSEFERDFERCHFFYHIKQELRKLREI